MSERVLAILRLAVTLVCMIASMFGVAIDYDSLYTIVMLIVTVVVVVYVWYKNNNLTEAAQVAQEFLDSLKASEDESAEIED